MPHPVSQLAQRLADGEPAAFDELYDQLGDRLLRYLAVRLGGFQADGREAAADVLQETFLRLVRARRKLAQVDNLTAYVFRVARNEAARWQSKHRLPVDHTVHPHHIAAPASDPSEAEYLLAAFARLPDAEREVVTLRLHGGLTIAEIAAATETRPGTVATRYRRAIERLRKTLAPQSD